jgi:YbbR domain-containing protein
VNLITDDWRLKLLAVGLAILMLGAVAFSQNPPKQKTLKDVNIVYAISPDLVVIDAPTKATVTVQGLADALTSFNAANVNASFDLTKAPIGPNVHVNLVIRPTVNQVEVVNPVVPYVLHIDKLVAKDLPVQVRTPRISSGWSLTKIEARCPNDTPTPCVVTFTGPASWEEGLSAKVDFPGVIQQNSQDVPSVQVQLVQANGQLLDLTKQTEPQIRFEPNAVTISAQAKPGTTLRQVVLVDAPPSHGPAPGYRVTNVTIDPITVVISGPPEILARINIVTLPAVDLSNATSSKTFQVSITYPDQAVVGPQVAKVTYSISANPNASPSP